MQSKRSPLMGSLFIKGVRWRLAPKMSKWRHCIAQRFLGLSLMSYTKPYSNVLFIRDGFMQSPLGFRMQESIWVGGTPVLRVWSSACVAIYVFSICPYGFPLGSPVSSQWPKHAFGGTVQVKLFPGTDVCVIPGYEPTPRSTSSSTIMLISFYQLPHCSGSLSQTWAHSVIQLQVQLQAPTNHYALANLKCDIRWHLELRYIFGQIKTCQTHKISALSVA